MFLIYYCWHIAFKGRFYNFISTQHIGSDGFYPNFTRTPKNPIYCNEITNEQINVFNVFDKFNFIVVFWVTNDKIK